MRLAIHSCLSLTIITYENQEIDHDLAYLIDHLSANFHLVIASRENPHLPLARLRVRDQLTALTGEPQPAPPALPVLLAAVASQQVDVEKLLER